MARIKEKYLNNIEYSDIDDDDCDEFIERGTVSIGGLDIHREQRRSGRPRARVIRLIDTAPQRKEMCDA